MSTKKTHAVVLTGVIILASFGNMAQAQQETNRRRFALADVVGKWAGVAVGTFFNQPFATNYVLDVDPTGNALFTLDSTSGLVTAQCTVSVEASGFGVAHCTDTSGPTNGVASDTHFVITDHGKKLTGWTSVPSFGYFITTTGYRQ